MIALPTHWRTIAGVACVMAVHIIISFTTECETVHTIKVRLAEQLEPNCNGDSVAAS